MACLFLPVLLMFDTFEIIMLVLEASRCSHDVSPSIDALPEGTSQTVFLMLNTYEYSVTMLCWSTYAT